MKLGEMGRVLTHADESGHVRMVDVSAKPETARRATAVGRVRVSPAVVELLRHGSLPKGDGLAVARVAAIQAVKATPQIIPLCHPITVDGVDVGLDVIDDAVVIEVTVTSVGRTGAEMEALTGVAAAALTIIDMVKAVDRHTVIEDVHVVAKSSGEDPGHGDPQVEVRVAMGYVIVSDRRSSGVARDDTGPLIEHYLAQVASTVASECVPDDEEAIQAAVLGLARGGCRIVVTSGGTGLGPRDRTPEALTSLIDTPVPGLCEALRIQGGRTTVRAALSRQVAGIIRTGVPSPTLVIALPGSVRAVEDSLEVLTPLIGHIVDQLRGGDHEDGGS